MKKLFIISLLSTLLLGAGQVRARETPGWPPAGGFPALECQGTGGLKVTSGSGLAGGRLSFVF